MRYPPEGIRSMGHRGQPGHPEVQKTILDGIATVRAAGILATDPALAHQYLDEGALFVAVEMVATRMKNSANRCCRVDVGLSYILHANRHSI